MARTGMSISVDVKTRQAIKQAAEREGVPISRAAEDLLLRGLAQGCTPQEVQTVVDGMAQAICEAVRDEVREIAETVRSETSSLLESVSAAQERLSDATGEMRLAEKNIGNGAQAALANYALTVWYEKAFLKAAGITAFGGAGPASYAAEHVRIEELYNWFWNIGGALRRNPNAKNFYPAMRQTGQLMKGHDLQDLTGVTPEAWERATGRSDSEAIAGLASEDGKGGDKHGRRKDQRSGYPHS